MRYQRIYHLLVVRGHHPFKAAEMILDAKREIANPKKGRFALDWIRRSHAMTGRQLWIDRKNSMPDTALRRLSQR